MATEADGFPKDNPIQTIKGQQSLIHGSHSVSVFVKDGNTSVGGMFRVAPTTKSSADYSGSIENEDGEDIPKDETVCRICLVELGEIADTLKMECSCKGELARAHQECVVKWFSIKGNRTCDVCKHEVQNLPVTLLPLPTDQPLNLMGSGGQLNSYRKNASVLVTINTLAYFCFLEKLLVKNMGSSAIALSLPFSCVLGLLASVASTKMVRRKHIWIYAIVQFVMMVLAGCLFYSLLHMEAIPSLLLTTFCGFGTVMCGAAILTKVFEVGRHDGLNS